MCSCSQLHSESARLKNKCSAGIWPHQKIAGHKAGLWSQDAIKRDKKFRRDQSNFGSKWNIYMRIRPKWGESKQYQPGLVTRGSKGRWVSGTYSGVRCILRVKSRPGGGGKLSCGGHLRSPGNGEWTVSGSIVGKGPVCGNSRDLQSLVCRWTATKGPFAT